MKKVGIAIAAVVVGCIVLAVAAYIIYANRVIGSYYGSEYEFIRIGDDVYVFDADDPYTSSDRRFRLGRVVSENGASSESMYIWSVKGTDEYIYRVWGLADGAFYRKESYETNNKYNDSNLY